MIDHTLPGTHANTSAASNQAVSPRSIIGSLNMIFGGIFFLIFSFNINSVELIHDYLGSLLLAVGCFRLMNCTVSLKYRRSMNFVFWVAAVTAAREFLLGIGATEFDRFPDLTMWLNPAIDALGLMATFSFCKSMHMLCEHEGLRSVLPSWKLTLSLFSILHVLPGGFLLTLAIAPDLTPAGLSTLIANAAVPALLVVLIPPVHLFVSTRRMKHAFMTMNSFN